MLPVPPPESVKFGAKPGQGTGSHASPRISAPRAVSASLLQFAWSLFGNPFTTGVSTGPCGKREKWGGGLARRAARIAWFVRGMRAPLEGTEGTLLEKLRKIEALHAGTKIDGEREAARRAAERIRARLAELRGREREEVYR